VSVLFEHEKAAANVAYRNGSYNEAGSGDPVSTPCRVNNLGSYSFAVMYPVGYGYQASNPRSTE